MLHCATKDSLGGCSFLLLGKDFSVFSFSAATEKKQKAKIQVAANWLRTLWDNCLPAQAAIASCHSVPNIVSQIPRCFPLALHFQSWDGHVEIDTALDELSPRNKSGSSPIFVESDRRTVELAHSGLPLARLLQSDGAQASSTFQRERRFLLALCVQVLCPVTLVRRKVNNALACQNKSCYDLVTTISTQNTPCCYMCKITLFLPFCDQYCASHCQT